MKRICRILSIIAVIVMLTASFCFADGTEGGLVLTDTYHKEGSSGAAIENFDVKLYFESDMTEDVLGDVNDGCFTLINEDGVELPTMVLYSPKEKGVVMVLFDYNKEVKGADGKKVTIEGDKEYTLKISGDLRDNEGNTLGADKTIKFTTINQRRNSIVSMLLMAVLYVGIIGFSMRNAKKNAEKEKNNRENKVNPYKEAKRTGKSVEEIVEKEQKKKERLERKRADSDDDDEEEEEPYLEEGHYRVKSVRTVASGGSSFITGRKAEAEARAEREARYAKNRKKVKGKGKKK